MEKLFAPRRSTKKTTQAGASFEMPSDKEFKVNELKGACSK